MDIFKITYYNPKTNKSKDITFHSITELIKSDLGLYEALRDCHVFEMPSSYMEFQGFRFGNVYCDLKLFFDDLK